jgi:hypothetical protein
MPASMADRALAGSAFMRYDPTWISGGGDAMRWIIGLLLLLGAVSALLAVWDGRIGHHDPALRAIHYDTNYDLSSQRRRPPDWNEPLPR